MVARRALYLRIQWRGGTLFSLTNGLVFWLTILRVLVAVARFLANKRSHSHYRKHPDDPDNKKSFAVGEAYYTLFKALEAAGLGISRPPTTDQNGMPPSLPPSSPTRR